MTYPNMNESQHLDNGVSFSSCPALTNCDAVGTFTNGSGVGRALVLQGS